MDKNLNSEVIFDNNQLNNLIGKYIPNNLTKDQRKRYKTANDIVMWNGELFASFNFGIVNFTKKTIIRLPNDEYNNPLDTLKERYYQKIKVDKNDDLIVVTEAVIVKLRFIDNQGTPTTYLDSSKTQIYRLSKDLNFKLLFDTKLFKIINSLSAIVIENDEYGNIWICHNQDKINQGGLIKIDNNDVISIINLESNIQKNNLIQPSGMYYHNNKLIISYFPEKNSGYLESISFYDIVQNKWEHIQDYFKNNPDYVEGQFYMHGMFARKIAFRNNKTYFVSKGIMIQKGSKFEYINFADSVKNRPGFEQSFYHFYEFNNIFFIDDNVYLMNVVASIIIKENLLSVEDDETKNQISIFPNPVNDLLNVNLDLSNGEKTNYKIFDMNSKIVNSDELLNNQIDVSNLIKGVYILEINNTNNANKIKFIKE